MSNSKNAATLLAILKWPLALLFFSFLPASSLEFGCQLILLINKSNLTKYLFFGFSSYMLVWYFFIRKTNISILSTFEHEITHCIFAWLTFNRVVGLTATLKSGGHMKYEGHANWLLSIAPYFFPTLTFCTLLIVELCGYSESNLSLIVIGATLAYHITSTFQETHHAQTDLQEVGFVFSCLFLPTANLICYLIVLAVLFEGWAGVSNLFMQLAQSPVSPFRVIY